jgi:pantoate--beta-alanine ligase
MVVRRLARDLDIPVRIEGVATVREPDGLALSSRNVYLSPDERRVAPQLHQVLTDTAEVLRERPDSVAAALAAGIAALEGAGFAVDYFELRDAADLLPMITLDRRARLLAAAHLERTRLIDNIPVRPG